MIPANEVLTVKKHRHRVLLAMERRMVREALKKMLLAQPDMQVVGEVDDPWDLLMAVREMDPDVLIQFWPDGKMPGVCTHVLTEAPHLLVLGVTPEQCFRCERVVTTVCLPDASPPDVLDAIRGRRSGRGRVVSDRQVSHSRGVQG
jgi:DNA-binding NarL/FixJ family response regulator